MKYSILIKEQAGTGKVFTKLGSLTLLCNTTKQEQVATQALRDAYKNNTVCGLYLLPTQLETQSLKPVLFIGFDSSMKTTTSMLPPAHG